MLQHQEQLTPQVYNETHDQKERYEFIMSDGGKYVLTGKQFEVFLNYSENPSIKILNFNGFGINISHIISYKRLENDEGTGYKKATHVIDGNGNAIDIHDL